MIIVNVEFTVVLNDDAKTDWIYNAIEENLEPNEAITDYSLEKRND